MAEGGGEAAGVFDETPASEGEKGAEAVPSSSEALKHKVLEAPVEGVAARVAPPVKLDEALLLPDGLPSPPSNVGVLAALAEAGDEALALCCPVAHAEEVPAAESEALALLPVPAAEPLAVLQWEKGGDTCSVATVDQLPLLHPDALPTATLRVCCSVSLRVAPAVEEAMVLPEKEPLSDAPEPLLKEAATVAVIMGEKLLV